MTVVIDASDRLCPSTGSPGAARAACRERTVSATFALEERHIPLAEFAVSVVARGDTEARIALRAHDPHGNNRHPARLTMGNGFAHACAKANDARLFYKGDDLSNTDLA